MTRLPVKQEKGLEYIYFTQTLMRSAKICRKIKKEAYIESGRGVWRFILKQKTAIFIIQLIKIYLVQPRAAALHVSS